MRNVMRGHIRARIVLGGRVEGYKGTMPGIAEETRISLEAGQPVFVLGGFGGCARNVAETVGLIERWSGSRDDWAGRHCFRKYFPDDLRNGLSTEENIVLAQTPHIQKGLWWTEVSVESAEVNPPMHKVFISYHHANDQWYKDALVDFGKNYSIFVDRSVDTADIPEEWTDQRIRRKIRDRHLRDSTVTIVLVGRETRRRKHIDWEIYSSMYDGSINSRSGIVVINLPGTSDYLDAPYGDKEKKLVYPDITSWTIINERSEYERRYPYMPDLIIDNLMKSDIKISVVPWERTNDTTLEFLIEAAFRNRSNCPYDLSRRMRRANS